MIETALNWKRNVEDIRRKNLEDNQLFLEQLRLTDVRKDFVNSARSILRRKENIKTPIEHQKIEYTTRYNIKVKFGIIPPHVPEWQRKKSEKVIGKRTKTTKEKGKKDHLHKNFKKSKKKHRLAKPRPPECSPWTLFNKNNPYPYHRIFKPRHTKVGERIRQNLI